MKSKSKHEEKSCKIKTKAKENYQESGKKSDEKPKNSYEQRDNSRGYPILSSLSIVHSCGSEVRQEFQ